ncbi:speckle-type POZ protein [Rhizophagus irregularis DAOM 181602=DAOM 197198]|nr:speckle-type POZ protein [Rhizophagus irregularis DAOM 181602=DAOM 197198]
MCRMYPSSSYYHLNSKCKILSHNSKIDPESAILYDSPINNNDNNNIYGLFNDKYPLHIIPHPKKENVFMNRISYDVMSDAYYENGIFNKKYIEFWDQGALYYENLIHATHYSDDRTYLRDTTALILENSKLSASIIYKFDYSSYETLSITRISYNVITNAYYENGKTDIKYLKRWDRGTFTNKNIYYSLENSTNIEKYLGVDKKNQSAHITWKFDYRPGNFYINSLKLLLKFHYSSNRSKIQWLIKLLPTRKNPISEFKPINFPLQENNILDLTEIVKDEYGFILKVKMIGGKNHLFRQDVNKNEKSLLNDNFDMDVEVKLRPNIICDEFFKKNFIYSMNEKNFLLNDKNTSDFIIKLKEELSTTNNYKNILEKNFYLHSKILISKSDYFKALFNSQMIESKNRFLNLNDLSLNIFEKLLLYIYYDNIDNLNDINDWIDLLYISSRFLIPKLVQICEFSIRNYVNIDNLEEINLIAKECNAIQLVKYCEMYEINV